MHKVDPLARQVGKSSEVLGRREPLRLEASHLTRRSRAALRRFAADNPAHSRIVAQALGVVHILVSGKATKYRLPEQPGQYVPTILATRASARTSPAISVKPSTPSTRRVRDKPAIQHRRSPGSRETGASSGGRNPAEQHPIPIHPLGERWPPRSIQGKMLIAISESRRPRRNSVHYPVNAGSLFPPPALGERCHRGLARRLVAVARRSAGAAASVALAAPVGSVRPGYALGR